MGILALEASSPDAVFEFLETNVSPRGRAHWHWKYQLGHGAPGRAFYHVAPDGSVGGFIGLLPTTLHTRDATARAAWFVDWATRPGEGSVGVGVGLLRRAEAATEVLLTLQGSADTRQILPKLRWRAVERPATWILRLSARSLGERGPARRHAWLRLPAVLLAGVARLAYRVPEPPPSAFALREVERFPESYDAVWAERRHEFAPLMERTSAQLNFMCADYPDGGYRRFLVLAAQRPVGNAAAPEQTASPVPAARQAAGSVPAGEQVVGHLVLRTDRKDGYVRGRIIDALWARERPGLVEWLVRQACWVLQECGVDYIECTASASDLERALRAARFRRRHPVPVWYHRLPADVETPDAWFVTYLDCDRAYR